MVCCNTTRLNNGVELKFYITVFHSSYECLVVTLGTDALLYCCLTALLYPRHINMQPILVFLINVEHLEKEQLVQGTLVTTIAFVPQNVAVKMNMLLYRILKRS